ncbi:unnamed protein product [Peronospora farinosa]|uniref:Crinkler effector protein N-terminal domain-containing protein n=1 Tax=Peronospora farinosa TaxID=134698 RepID=A0AAV0T7X3_9STRA|nr:unnamed protein product [Peronospora farinosa]
MVKLFCVIFGMKESVFPVNIDTTMSVGDLKEAIAAKKTNALKNVDANHLRLFLAKEMDGEWLASDLKIVKKLKKGKKNSYIEALTAKKKNCRQITPLMLFLMKILSHRMATSTY